MIEQIRGVVGAALLTFCVIGCNKGSDSSQATTGPGGADVKPLKLAFVSNNSSDFWTIARAGTAKAVEETPNISVDFEMPGDGSAAKQTSILDDILARGVDGIAISPVDPANETAKLNEIAKQAMLVCHDSDAPNSDRACYVGTNNVEAGKQAGDLVKQALPNGGKIMVFVGQLDPQNAHDRYQGLKESLAGSNVSIIDIRTDNTDPVAAKSNVIETIVKYPDVAGFVGLWSYNGPAILNACIDQHKVGQLKIVAFDEQDETLAGIKSGAIYATVVQQPYEFGRQAIELMAKTLRGDKSLIPASKQIFIPTLAIKQDNVDDFAAKLKVLRGK